MRDFFREILIILIIAIVIFLLLNTAIVIPPSEVVSSSMEPTLQIGQRLMISKIAYAFHEPERGDIITFHPPFASEEPFIKRIIGLPGESVEIKGGIVYIHKEDGTVVPLDEPYITNPAKDAFQGDEIPENEYFVLGDNRNNSSDSRTGWTAKREDIIGKAWLSIWPPGEWGLVAHYSLQEQLVSSMSKQLPLLGVD